MSDFPNFFGKLPSDQNALDLFAGEWSSRPPADRSDLKAGDTPLFDDPRLTWAQDRFMESGLEGGFRGRRVLELGPLEAGHAWGIEHRGAESITSVEANARAYMKCLIAKEVYGLPRTRFLLGDCLEYLRDDKCPRYDIGVAAGILYHLTNPVELLELLARRCDAIFLWTVFYDPEFIKSHPEAKARFTDEIPQEHAGYKHTVHRFNYGASLDWKGFCGGGAIYSYWMEKPEIVGALERFGFTDVRTLDQPNVHGSALLLTARRAR